MSKYKEILRYYFLGRNQIQIAGYLNASRNTIRPAVRTTRELELSWIAIANMTEDEVRKLLFPDDDQILDDDIQPKPDYE